jgi:hypothetical protein
MKISKKSWHYKVVRWFYQDVRKNHFDIPTNLCGYVRNLFYVTLIAIISALFLAYTIYGFAIMIDHGWALFRNDELLFGLFEVIAVIVSFMVIALGLLIGCAFLAAVCLVWVCVAVEAIVNYRTRKQLGLITKKEPGLVRQWLKAKKEKVCPRIEYVDE